MKIDPYELKSVMVGVTARCNAMCPGCPRNIDGALVNYDMIGTSEHWDMPLGLFEKFFTPELVNSLDWIEMCGNFGDPCMHPKFLEIMQYLKNTHKGDKKFYVTISTNGSMQTENFWKTLGEMHSDNFGVEVLFCLDGDNQDSHVKYRRLTNFDTILENAKTFINAGGVAVWQAIEFDHNKHEIENARTMTKEIGFDRFTIQSGQGRLTGYLENELEGKPHDYGSKTKKQNEENISYDTKPTYQKMKKEIEKYTDKKVDDMQWNEVQQVLTHIPVECQWEKESSILFEFDGSIWRCCFHGTLKNKNQWKENVVGRYGENWNNIQNHNLKDILEHEFFTTYLDESFTNPDGPFKRLNSCTEACGVHLNFMQKHLPKKT